MFNLEEAIINWRQRLAQHETMGGEIVAELEDHLREAIQALTEAGLTETEAFWLAAKRMGTSETLTMEFEKVSNKSVWLRRLQWMLSGYLVIHLLTQGIDIFSFQLASLVAALQSSGVIVVTVYILSNLMIFGGLYWGMHQLVTQNKTQLARRIYQKITLLIPSRRQTVVSIIVLVLFLVGGVMSVGTNVLLVNLLPHNEITPFYTGRTYYQFGLSLLLPLSIVITVFWLRRQRLTLIR
ncbi:MAG: permease prefix domain 1-containing protein [Chloroflexota bacterium]